VARPRKGDGLKLLDSEADLLQTHAQPSDAQRATCQPPTPLYLATGTLPLHTQSRMPKSRSPKRPMLPWVSEPRAACGQEMTYGTFLERYLKRFGQARPGGSAPAFTE
jgi:hypothetical protein